MKRDTPKARGYPDTRSWIRIPYGGTDPRYSDFLTTAQDKMATSRLSERAAQHGARPKIPASSGALIKHLGRRDIDGRAEMGGERAATFIICNTMDSKIGVMRPVCSAGRMKWFGGTARTGMGPAGKRSKRCLPSITFGLMRWSLAAFEGAYHDPPFSETVRVEALQAMNSL